MCGSGRACAQALHAARGGQDRVVWGWHTSRLVKRVVLAPYQPQTSPIPAPNKPHTSPKQAPYQPQTSPIPAPNKPHTSPKQAPYRPPSAAPATPLCRSRGAAVTVPDVCKQEGPGSSPGRGRGDSAGPSSALRCPVALPTPPPKGADNCSLVPRQYPCPWAVRGVMGHGPGAHDGGPRAEGVRPSAPRAMHRVPLHQVPGTGLPTPDLLPAARAVQPLSFPLPTGAGACRSLFLCTPKLLLCKFRCKIQTKALPYPRGRPVSPMLQCWLRFFIYEGTAAVLQNGRWWLIMTS